MELHIVHGRLIKPPICYSEYKFWLLFPKIILLFGAAAKKKIRDFYSVVRLFVHSFVCSFVHLCMHLFVYASHLPPAISFMSISHIIQ